jgi:hypothetical protein
LFVFQINVFCKILKVTYREAKMTSLTLPTDTKAGLADPYVYEDHNLIINALAEGLGGLGGGVGVRKVFAPYRDRYYAQRRN